MVNSLAISIGNLNSYVAAAQCGGVEILLNEFSARSTPSMVAFTDKCRSFGLEASSNLFMNLKNTIYDLMFLLCKPYKDIDTSAYPFKLEENPENGEALYVVKYLNEEKKFTITQILAMLFTKLKSIGNNATDCCISCPQFFDENQKAALANAALIAGLNPLQIISDMSAIVLNYAHFRTTKEEAQKFVAFVNFGQSNLQTCIALLTPKDETVRILSAESELIGGKDFDRILADHFVKEHKLTLNQKAYLKLVFSCEKLKRLLSANANDIPLHVESLISEDKDFSARIDRATFENLSKHLLERVEACFRRALESAKSSLEEGVEFDLSIVEMVGGSTRIPAIKQLVQNVFNIAPSTTLNTDEAVARGCVLHCATLHPGMKVKSEFKILGSESIFFNPSNISCDSEARKTELELIMNDARYKSRTEARNNLEEFVYVERSKLQEGDPILAELSSTLDWLMSDDGEDAKEEEYVSKMNALREKVKSKLVADGDNNNVKDDKEDKIEAEEKIEAEDKIEVEE